MNVNDNYKALIEGRMSKSEFLRQARQGLPQYITNFTSFDDAVRILRQKSIISEELVYTNKADKFPLEAIQRGIRYELEAMGVVDSNSPTREEYKKARQRAIDNLCKDSLYYLNKVAEQTPQPKATEEDQNDKMKKVQPSKKNIQEGRYIREAGDLAVHKDVNLKSDVGSGTEEPVAKKVKAAPVHYKDNHDWTVNEYKIAYILAEFGKKGLVAVFNHFGTKASNVSMKLLANTVIGTTDAGLEFAIQGMKKVINGEKDTEWLQSYFRNNKSIEAYNELNGKSFDECIASLSKETCSEKEAEEAIAAQEKKDKVAAGKASELSAATKAIRQEIFDKYKEYRDKIVKSVGDKVKGEKIAFLSACKEVGINKDSGDKRAIAWALLRGSLYMSSQTIAELDKLLSVDNKNIASLKTRNLAEAAWSEYSNDPVYIQFYQHYLKKAKEAKDVNADKTARAQAKKAFLRYKEKQGLQEQKNKIDQMVLKETIVKLVGKVLTEAATANLAQLSDENASVAELPAAINSLENIVTEIESFWLKEQQKIQGVFDSLGNIKNEDGLPIGYKFAQPMMESLKKDLEPVLSKISLEAVKLPEAPAPDQTQVNDPNAEVDPNDPNAIPPLPEKETVFSPGKRESLQENKKNRRYTK